MIGQLRIASLFVLVVVTACERAPTVPLMANGEQQLALAKGPPADPTATWSFPLADAGLSVRSDHKYPSGNYSLYADGVCSVSSQIFLNGTGDNTIGFSFPKTTGKGACGRTWTLAYSDGFTETLSYGGGVQILQNASFTIPVGTTALRHFRIGTSSINSGNPVAARCTQGLVFGPGGANAAIGSDSITVTRLDASTWNVKSQLAPNDNAYCIDNGQLYHMQVEFLITSSRALP